MKAVASTVDGEYVCESREAGRLSRLLPGTVAGSQLVDDLVVGSQFQLGAVRSTQPHDEDAALRLPVPDVADDVDLSTGDHRVARRQLHAHRVLLTGRTTTYRSSTHSQEEKYQHGSGLSSRVVSASDCGVKRPTFESQRGRWCLSRQPLRYTALGTGCAHLLQCLGRLSLPPSSGR